MPVNKNFYQNTKPKPHLVAVAPDMLPKHRRFDPSVTFGDRTLALLASVIFENYFWKRCFWKISIFFGLKTKYLAIIYLQMPAF